MLALALILTLAAQDRTDSLPGPDGETDMRPQRQSRRCASENGEIVVCATTMSPARTRELEQRFAEKPLRPGVNLRGGGRIDAQAAQHTLPGASAPALLLNLKVPLGRGKKRDEAK